MQGNQSQQALEMPGSFAMATIDMLRMPTRSPPWRICNWGKCRRRWTRRITIMRKIQGSDILPPLALSYALQGVGRLAQAQYSDARL
jgi:hypothetical protein